MSIDRSKRIIFEEVAEVYDEVRPGYPEELVDDVVALSGLPTEGRILEVGCGPGNATVLFARRGYRILAIELGARLAALAARKCRAYPGVKIHNSAFEDWKTEEKAFDLAISAEAFHWIPPEISYPKLAKTLKESGSAALIWHVPVDPQTDWSRAIDAVYQQHAPDQENPDQNYTFDWLTGIITGNFEASGCFGEVTVKSYRWNEWYSTDRYLKTLRTFSGHHGLDAGTRERLFAGIRAVIDGHGGQVEKPQLVALFHAHVK